MFIPAGTRTRFTTVLRNAASSQTWTCDLLVQPTLSELVHTLGPLKQQNINNALTSFCSLSAEINTIAVIERLKSTPSAGGQKTVNKPYTPVCYQQSITYTTK